ncbi:MAG: Eco57I restriction-modification methylase domain-containing protein [Ruminococcus sp.]|nr:Eco57I restriction-modification methylase domain-containing protein [Ruminococcus sp.]
MQDLIEIDKYPVKFVLKKLLCDKTTGKNIIYATNQYSVYGCRDSDQILVDDLLGFDSLAIQPRVRKSQAEQNERTRTKAEVFTPTWIVKQMNEQVETNDDWQKVVTQRVLEITCGEAPFLVTRYDTTTGENISLWKRVGLLDRKLQAISRNTETEADWLKWTYKAFENTYGYEYQGDNLLIARINLLVTFSDYLQDKWNRPASEAELNKIANIIVWNIFQMDGLKDTVPLGVIGEKFHQFSLFDDPDEQTQADDTKIYNHRVKKSLLFRDLKEGEETMKFDFIIGNPPYQDDTVGEQKSFAAPIYDKFLDGAYTVADVVEMIHPARFLFNAGGTQKAWNRKMLDDPHLKVLWYEADSSKVFSNTDIKGGIAITYRNANQDFGAIDTFTAFPELNSIRQKVWSCAEASFSDIVSNRGQYRFSDLAYKEQPQEMEKVTDPRISAPVFERMPKLFTDEKPDDGFEYIRIFGNMGKNRVYKWFRKDYLKEIDSLYKYKVFIPKANGSGAIGEVLSTPLVGEPLVGSTETFLSIGNFETFDEANSCLRYIKTKFARVMLGILKITQDNAKPVWKYVPLQDFTKNSDIDWSKSVHEIDLQLYRKYGLDEKEIEFIETHVKEME